MGRGKVTLQLIENRTERKISFVKRKAGLIKKLKELSILCDLETCAIIYSDFKPGPEIWPNDRNTVLEVLNQLTYIPVEKQTKYMTDPAKLMEDLIQEAEKKLEKARKYTRAMELGWTASFEEINDGDYSEELEKASDVMEKKLKAVRERIEFLESGKAE